MISCLNTTLPIVVKSMIGRVGAGLDPPTKLAPFTTRLYVLYTEKMLGMVYVLTKERKLSCPATYTWFQALM